MILYVHYNIDSDVEEYAAIYEDLETACANARLWMENHIYCVSRVAEYEIGSGNIFSSNDLLQYRYHWETDPEKRELLEEKLIDSEVLRRYFSLMRTT